MLHTPSLRVEMLGGLRVVQDQRITSRFRTHKTGALLAFLAYHRHHTHARERLIDMLWPEMTIDAGRNSLSIALSGLRSLLDQEAGPSVVLAGRTAVGLDPLRVTTDVGLFEAAIGEQGCFRDKGQEARMRGLAGRVGLYQGELLPGYYEDWIQPERTRLQNLCTSALVELAEQQRAIGDRESALESARRATTVDPFHEEAHRLLIRLLLEAAQPAAALRQYRMLEQRFQTELDIAPHADTRALIAAILPVSPASATPRSPYAPSSFQPLPQHTASQVSKARVPAPSFSSLPPRFDGFFGREQEIANLSALLAQPGCLVTLTGPGGVGKTRMALEVAEMGAAAYNPLFISLVEVHDAEALLETVRRALDLPTVDDPLAAVVQRLSRKPLLLILDNFEQIAPQGAVLLRDLMHRTPTLRCLVTSRRRLLLDREQEMALLPLLPPEESFSRNAEPTTLLQNACVALFVERARTSRPGFALTARNAASLVGLVTQLEGLPLALELAAARAAVLTPRQMLEALRHRPFDLLTGRNPLLADRHRSLRDTIAWSYEMLAPDLQRFFRLLAVFHGGWSLEGAMAVTGDPSAMDHLAQLQEASLIQAEEGHGEDHLRFSMLVTLHTYAAEQLNAEPDATAARTRHAAFFSALAAQSVKKMHGPEEDTWLLHLDVERENIKAAFAFWATSPGGWARALDLACDLRWFWITHGNPTDGTIWLENVLNVEGAATLYTPAARARALSVLAQLHNLRYGSSEAVLPLLIESRRIYEELGDQEALALLYLLWNDDLHLAEKAVSICLETGNERLLAVTMENWGRQLWRTGEQVQAEALFSKSAGLLRKHRSNQLIGLLGEWSYMLLWRGEYRRACVLLEEALTIGESRRGRDLHSHIHWMLGSVLIQLGDYPRARLHIEASASVRREFGACQALGSTLTGLIALAIAEQNFADAHAALAELDSVITQIGWTQGQAYARNARGRLALYENRNTSAYQLYAESRDRAHRQQDAAIGGQACSGLGWLGIRMQDWTAATTAFTEGLRLHAEVHNARGQVDCLHGLFCAATGLEQWEQAAFLFGWTQASRETSGMVLAPLERTCCEQAEAATRFALGETAFRQALNAGRAAFPNDPPLTLPIEVPPSGKV